MGSFFGATFGQTISIEYVLFNLLLAFALSFLIAWFYKKTHRGLSYSQSFILTLVLMSVIVTVIMMVIGSNLARAFTLLGAFTVIRFRTAVKETKDTGYIFLSLVVGMAVGTDNYLIAVVGTVFILLMIWFLDKINFGSMRSHEFLLSFLVRHEERDQTSFEQVFQQYLKSSMLLNITAKDSGRASGMTYSVTFRDESKTHDLIRELANLPGMSAVEVISSATDMEY